MNNYVYYDRSLVIFPNNYVSVFLFVIMKCLNSATLRSILIFSKFIGYADKFIGYADKFQYAVGDNNHNSRVLFLAMLNAPQLPSLCCNDSFSLLRQARNNPFLTKYTLSIQWLVKRLVIQLRLFFDRQSQVTQIIILGCFFLQCLMHHS